MNILIKLMSIVSLVIAPYIAVVSSESGMEGGCEEMSAECGMMMDKECCKMMKKECCKNDSTMKCDMEMVTKMSAEECAAYCDSLKCTPEEKAMCMKHAGMAKEKECCKKKAADGEMKMHH